jgi:hypothetical protein
MNPSMREFDFLNVARERADGSDLDLIFYALLQSRL